MKVNRLPEKIPTSPIAMTIRLLAQLDQLSSYALTTSLSTVAISKVPSATAKGQEILSSDRMIEFEYAVLGPHDSACMLSGIVV
jgi:hypothetical protein